MNLRIFCEREPWNMGRIALYIRDGATAAGHVIMAPVEDGARSDPAITLQPDQAQALIDELWRTGLRPTEGTGSAGSLAATERHLADMRALVFKTKKP